MNSLKSVPQIFSARRRAATVLRAEERRKAAGAAQWLAEDMADEVIERLDFMRFQPSNALVTGLNGALLCQQLEAAGTDAQHHSLSDHEKPIAGSEFELIASCASLETVNDLPGALLHIRNALSDGGLFIGQLIGAGSLAALRQIMLTADGERPAARIHPQIDNRAATGLMERAGFSRQVVDSRVISVRFSSLERLVGDLRDQGLGNILADHGPALTREGLARAREAFTQLADEEGRLTERFEILTLTGWR